MSPETKTTKFGDSYVYALMQANVPAAKEVGDIYHRRFKIRQSAWLGSTWRYRLESDLVIELF